ncbi:MAG: glycosyltransferase family 4 protein [Minisyncoccota bacterium]
MKILYGITKSNFGGAQRYVFDMAVGAKKAGHEVAVLCGLPAQAGGHGTLIEKLNEENIRIIPLDTMERDISLSKEISSFFQIIKVLDEEDPDVFHINSSKMGGLGGVAGRIAHVKKIVFTAHGWAFNEPRPVWQKIIIKFFVWLTLLFSHKIICVSEKTRRDVSSWPFIKKKLKVIYNGLEKFGLTPRTDETFTVGTIAELHKIKGLDILLTAWSKFIKNLPAQAGHSAKLIIIGGGEERENLQNMANNLGISDNVIFKGFVDNARSLLSTFDIFVLPSRSEAMPYAPLEAGLAGLPVIATSVGGIPEIIENNVSGILIERENSEELLSALIKLYEDANLRKSLGENLKKKVETEFSLDKMVRETLELYK